MNINLKVCFTWYILTCIVTQGIDLLEKIKSLRKGMQKFGMDMVSCLENFCFFAGNNNPDDNKNISVLLSVRTLVNSNVRGMLDQRIASKTRHQPPTHNVQKQAIRHT